MRYLSLAVVALALLVGCTQAPATCTGPTTRVTACDCDCADTGKCTCASTCKCLPTKR